MSANMRADPYWRDDQGRLNCRHGVILYGSGCTRCERELIARAVDADFDERYSAQAIRLRGWRRPEARRLSDGRGVEA